MFLLVGLGNPGEKYIGTRHNLGFEVLDEFRRKKDLGDWLQDDKFKAEVIKTKDLILVKPRTYMNLSGMAVSKIAKYYKIKPREIVVIHD